MTRILLHQAAAQLAEIKEHGLTLDQVGALVILNCEASKRHMALPDDPIFLAALLNISPPHWITRFRAALFPVFERDAWPVKVAAGDDDHGAFDEDVPLAAGAELDEQA